MAEEFNSLEFTPTWVVAVVCFIIVLISLCAERGLHKLGKCLMHKNQEALFEALQKLKEELMLLGFISLMLTVLQGPISNICVSPNLKSHMLPCKKHSEATSKQQQDYSHQHRRLLSSDTGPGRCVNEGKIPLLSLEALHQLHIFIFVLAVVHVSFCATTMILGGARISQWKYWEDSIKTSSKSIHEDHRKAFMEIHAGGYWRRAAVVSWMRSFFKQFYGSVTKSDYITLRQGFIMTHCPSNSSFDFHKYMLRTLEVDFKKVVSIRWYLWLFVVVFLLLNVEGWHTYFWLSFLPLILLLMVGTKLEHVISRLALEVAEKRSQDQEAARAINPSDELFWFGRPGILLNLIHFILFQNSFEIAFFFWILSTYGFHSCIMEKLGYIIPRLLIGVIVQVLCSYSTLPLYALVTQMGSKFKVGMFDKFVQSSLVGWAGSAKSRGESSKGRSSHSSSRQMYRMDQEPSPYNHQIAKPAMIHTEEDSEYSVT